MREANAHVYSESFEVVEQQCVCIAFLLIPTLGKSKLYVNVRDKNPDHVSQNLVLSSLHLTKKAQFDTEFSKILNLKDDAVPTIL